MKSVLIALLGLLLAAPMAYAADSDHIYVVKKSGEVSSYTAPQGSLFFKDSDIFYFKLNTFEATSETVVTGSFTVDVMKEDIKSFASSIMEVGIAYSWYHKEPVYGLDAWMKLGDSLKSDAYTFTIHGLDHGVTYYIRPYVKVLGKVYYGNVTQSITTQGDAQTLNLNVKIYARDISEGTTYFHWIIATKYNVGSCTEGNPGTYFAWGEIEPKDEYTWDNYKWSKGDTITGYVPDTEARSLKDCDDAATLAFGSGSHSMPPEIGTWLAINNYNKVWSSRIAPDGSTMYGIELSSWSSEGEYLFIPAAGYYDGKNLVGYNEQVWLWSERTYTQTSGPKESQTMSATSAGVTGTKGKERYLGIPIRPMSCGTY